MIAALRIVSSMLAALACTYAAGVYGQSYPAKPVRLIIPFAPGGGSDLMGRLLAQRLGDRFGQQFVVDNRPGAGGSIGTEAAVKAPPDGYTLVLGSTSEISINPSLYTRLSYNTLRDLAPVAIVAYTPLVLVVHPSMPTRSVKEVIALAKARPGDINFASAGNGTTTHLTGELFRSATGVNVVHVPYKGGGPAVAELVGGQTQMMFSTAPPVMPFVQGGRLRALAVTTARRSAALKDIPTMQEAGVKGFEVTYWWGVFAPSATGKSLVALLHKEINQILRTPDMIAAVAKQGAEAATMTIEQFADFVKADAAKWAQAVKISGAKAD
ncbi:MAG: tripartite tricarboxylate transporter substrate binding protein [Betaproteobacteria bacterium]|nr:tripartite tricarboxylate transporter substrate binding protein [Betaproteobacteria bacterium]